MQRSQCSQHKGIEDCIFVSFYDKGAEQHCSQRSNCVSLKEICYHPCLQKALSGWHQNRTLQLGSHPHREYKTTNLKNCKPYYCKSCDGSPSKTTDKALSIPLEAALAVLTFSLTEAFIPIKPREQN